MRNTIGTLLADFRIRMTVLAILGGLACTSHAQNITTFDPPNSTYTIGTAINPRGQITGYFRDGRGNHGFLRQRNGTFITFDVVVDPRPGGFPPNAFPMDINAGGQITGFYEDETVIGSFLRQTDGTILKIPSPNTLLTSSTAMDQGVNQGPRPFCSDGSAALAINAVGQITGGGYLSFFCHGFLRQPKGVTTTFDIQTDCCPPNTEPQAINLFGQITGFYSDISGFRGFLRQPDGGIVRFDPPDSVSTIPQAINLFVQITGYYRDANSVVHSFLRQPNGTIITFDPAGSTDTEAKSINPEGEITGFYLGADGIYHGFLRKLNGAFTSFDAPNSQGTFAQSARSQGITSTGTITTALFAPVIANLEYCVEGFARASRTCQRRSFCGCVSVQLCP